MKRCYNSAVRMPKEPWLCCYGAPGCTAAPLSTSQANGSYQEDTAPGSEQRKDKSKHSPSEQQCQTKKQELSSDASMQDPYLLIKISYAAGWRASEHVQATPSKESAPSPLGTAEQFGSWIKECQATEWRLCSGVLLPCSKSTTPSSKQSGLYECPRDGMKFKTAQQLQKHYFKRHHRNGCLGKLQEGRQ